MAFCRYEVSSLLLKIFLLISVLRSEAQEEVTFTRLPENQTVIEGEAAQFECNASVANSNGTVSFFWRVLDGEAVVANIGENMSDITGISRALFLENGQLLVLQGVQRQVNGFEVACRAGSGLLLTTQDPPFAALSVVYPPTYTPSPPDQSTTPTEGATFIYNYEFEANPQPDEHTWTRDGKSLTSGDRITLTANSRANSITITDVSRSDSGVYTIFSNTSAGSGTANFTLDVYYPPVLGDIQQSVTLNAGDPFTLDCTPVESNPPATVSFSYNNTGTAEESVTTTGYVLSVSSVVRNHRGEYSCEVSNGVGRDSVIVQLMVTAPPTVPQQLMSSDVSPFSATISWMLPEDDGGTDQPLMYSITITNYTDSTSLPPVTTNMTTLSFAYLQHSTRYIVNIVADNDLGLGPSPPAVINFTTPDSVPIIESVSVEALSLTILSVDVVLLTDGGQNVTSYTVLVTSDDYTNESVIPLAQLTSHNLTVDNLTKGEHYRVNVTATNSVGISETFQSNFTVPLPPAFNTTMSAPLDLSDIPPNTCCGGIQLGLQNPNNPVEIQVQVSTGGGDFSEANFTRNITDMDIIYVEGLVAGTEYTIRVRVSNVFGSEMRNVTTTPLIGTPSKPSRPAVTVAGSSVTVSVGVPSPGTRGDVTVSVGYQRVSAKRQSDSNTKKNKTFSGSPSAGPVTGDVTFEGLPAGDFIVRVTAMNEFGESEMSEESITFQVTAPPSQAADNTGAIIGGIVGAILGILVLILVILIIVLCCMKYKADKGDYKMTKKEENELEGIHYTNVDGVKLNEPISEPVYDEAKTDGTDGKGGNGTSKTHNPPAEKTEGLMYADLDFSRNEMQKAQRETKQPEPATIYAEVTVANTEDVSPTTRI